MYIVFDKMHNFEPFNDKFSVYLHKIAGRYLGEIIAESILLHKKGRKHTSIFLKDPILACDKRFNKAISKYMPVTTSRPRGDLVDADIYYTVSEGRPLRFKYPWDILGIKDDYLKKLKRRISNKAKIEKGVEINGNVVIEEGVRILSGARIKGSIYIGKDSFIANNALIRNNTSIGSNCVVAYSSDVKDSLVQDGSGIGPLVFLGDSIIGYESFFGGMARSSNYRLDKKNVEVLVGHKKVDTKRRFLGCFIGNRTSLGIRSIVLPGRKIGNDVIIGPQVIVEKNIESSKKVILKQSLIMESRNEKK
ncbi:MAG: hypothetical protein KKD29_02140 [Candidatus Omnitrophica bacterium]|nr:hypothetical protein [Candidatus Omnitrophota bacterium]MBU4488907.1 hypothetical protein [Candidatus Omnitrophota bacterium]